MNTTSGRKTTARQKSVDTLDGVWLYLKPILKLLQPKQPDAAKRGLKLLFVKAIPENNRAGKHWRAARPLANSTLLEAEMDNPNVRHSGRDINCCAADGCNNPVTRRGASYCLSHPWGRGAKARTPERVIAPHGYVRLYCPDHPLTLRRKRSTAREYEHRVVFYDTFGEGPFRCDWCGCRLTWANLHIDHINGVRHDNRVENLAASCIVCNGRRATPAIRASNRTRSRMLTFNGETKTIMEWSEALGIHRGVIDQRLQAGASVDEALSTEKKKRGPKPKRAA